jgi:uncharacterized protein (DUF58 family)
VLNHTAYRLYRAVSSLRHWAIRRFTPAGWLVFVGLILTSGMAMDTEQSLGYQLFTLLLCFAAAAMAVAPFFRARFSAERFLPKFGGAGQPLRYTVSVRNLTRRVQAGLEILDGLTDPRPTFDEFLALTHSTKRRGSFRFLNAPDIRRVRAIKPQPLPSLPPKGEASVEIELVPLKRGVLHFDSVTVARPDPFMLFRAFSIVKLPAAITILPKRYVLPPIALPGSQQYQHGGVALATAIGESEEFVSLRDYRPGDPLRRIHWRSWAKVGRPVVKEFQDEFFIRHALILDTFSEEGGAGRAVTRSPRSARQATTQPRDAAVFEEAISVAASFACTIDTQESLLDLLFIGPEAFCFTIGRGVAHADQMLEILASVAPTPEKSFAALEQLVVEHASSVSGCICIFLAWDEPRRRLVRKLTALGVPVMVLVIRAAGAAPFERGVDDPEALHMLEAAKIEAGLALL